MDILGDYTAARFGDLPFLFKVLAAETPLSIQVHPSKRKAKQGFERENLKGILTESAFFHSSLWFSESKKRGLDTSFLVKDN